MFKNSEWMAFFLPYHVTIATHLLSIFICSIHLKFTFVKRNSFFLFFFFFLFSSPAVEAEWWHKWSWWWIAPFAGYLFELGVIYSAVQEKKMPPSFVLI